MPSKYGKILSDDQLKELLFEVVQEVNGDSYGKSACWGSLSLIHAVGQGLYYTNTKNCGLAKCIKLDNPKLYDKLSIFFRQNAPEDVLPADDADEADNFDNYE
jgi:hypothetical protein